MKKIALISANLGKIDSNDVIKHAPQVLNKDYQLEFISLNDRNFYPRINSLHPRLQAKIPKMLVWEVAPDYDIYIWMDSSIKLIKHDSINWLIEQLNGNYITLFKHNFRSSIRDELEYIKEHYEKHSRYLINRYKNEPLQEQVDLYLSDSSFNDVNLYQGGIFIYDIKNKPELKLFFKDWFYHCARYSIQDQLSLPYLLHKHHINPKIINENIYKSEYIKYFGHQTKLGALSLVLKNNVKNLIKNIYSSSNN